MIIYYNTNTENTEIHFSSCANRFIFAHVPDWRCAKVLHIHPNQFRSVSLRVPLFQNYDANELVLCIMVFCFCRELKAPLCVVWGSLGRKYLAVTWTQWKKTPNFADILFFSSLCPDVPVSFQNSLWVFGGQRGSGIFSWLFYQAKQTSENWCISRCPAFFTNWTHFKNPD